jgi:2-polyprenyl-6-methoxyphenol hydroxylase-like FAD-dependent oxidoreductase
MTQAGPQHREEDILAVSAGPSGVSLAIEFGCRGVSVRDQNARIGEDQRTKTVHIRSLKSMRRWGIALIHPDQYVARRADAPPDTPRHLLEIVRGATNTSQA